MDRFWGENKDATAAKQLGLSNEWTIFMMANEMDYIEDIRAVVSDVYEADDWHPDVVVEEIEKANKRVKLTGKLQFVGMCMVDDFSKECYGVVDFTEEG